jgi:hypothetical protein
MVGRAVVTTRASSPAMKAAIDVMPSVQRCNALQCGAPACLVLPPVICFSLSLGDPGIGTAVQRKDERCGGQRTYPERTQRRSGTARESAELGPYGLQPALQEALLDFAGRQRHRGVKFPGRVARAAKPAQAVRQGGVPQM